jgi:nicotinic acid mononucleotide adenylyltransferase
MASVSIVAGCRDVDDEADLRTSAEELIKEGARIVLLSFSPIETSSSELRISDPVKSADSGLISNEVADYIIKRGLYSK